MPKSRVRKQSKKKLEQQKNYGTQEKEIGNVKNKNKNPLSKDRFSSIKVLVIHYFNELHFTGQH